MMDTKLNNNHTPIALKSLLRTVLETQQETRAALSLIAGAWIVGI
jgi:hypothetical protein